MGWRRRRLELTEFTIERRFGARKLTAREGETPGGITHATVSTDPLSKLRIARLGTLYMVRLAVGEESEEVVAKFEGPATAVKPHKTSARAG